MNKDLTQRTLDMIQQMQNNLNKTTFLTSTGLVNTDLERPARSLFPALSPLVNMIPRVNSNAGDTATRWKGITTISGYALNPGVSEGKRGGEVAVTLVNFLATYATLGQEISTSFEAESASQGFDDARAKAAMVLLNSIKIAEELVVLGGNTSTALGTVGTVTPSTATTGGTIAAATYNVIMVALTLEGFQNSSVSATGVPGVIARTNIDGSTDNIGGGSSMKSAAASQITTGATSTITGQVVDIPGAVAYAMYVGTAGAEKIASIGGNKQTITALPAGGNQNASAITADNSVNALEFDGLLPIATKSGNNGYVVSLDGATLTADTAAGVVEIDAMLKNRYDLYRLSPDTLWIASQEAVNINKKIVGNGGAPLIRFTAPISAIGGTGASDLNNLQLSGGTAIGSYFNKFTNSMMRVVVHPYLPAGVLLGTTSKLPYLVPDIPDTNFRIKCRRPYYQIEWPLIKRRYEAGVYAEEVLQHYAPFSMGVIKNIGNG
jgi:hypothetical protein